MTNIRNALIQAAGSAGSDAYWVGFYHPNVTGSSQREGFNIYGADVDDDGNLYLSGSNDQALNFSQ